MATCLLITQSISHSVGGGSGSGGRIDKDDEMNEHTYKKNTPEIKFERIEKIFTAIVNKQMTKKSASNAQKQWLKRNGVEHRAKMIFIHSAKNIY